MSKYQNAHDQEDLNEDGLMVKRKKNHKMVMMMNLEANRKVSGHEETKECRCEVDYGDESKPDDGDDHGGGDNGDGDDHDSHDHGCSDFFT